MKIGSKDVGLLQDHNHVFEYLDTLYVFESYFDSRQRWIEFHYFHRFWMLKGNNIEMDLSLVFRHSENVTRARLLSRKLTSNSPLWLPDETISAWVDLSMPMPDELGVEFLPTDLSAIASQVREMNIDPEDRHKLLTAIRLLL